MAQSGRRRWSSSSGGSNPGRPLDGGETNKTVRVTKKVAVLVASGALGIAYSYNNHRTESTAFAFPKVFFRHAAASSDAKSGSVGDTGKRKVSIHAARGPRATMEDRWFVSDDLRFVAVYDGHGGHRVADMAHKHLYDEFTKLVEELTPQPSEDVSEPSKVPTVSERVSIIKQALLRSFETVSRKILSTTYLDLEGSTAVVVYVSDDGFISANLGDSRAILCRGPKAIPLTKDHKPDTTSERKRIEDLGGRVKWHGYLGPDKLPVPGMGAYRINGNLAVSRAFGDRLERPYVSSEPEITVHERNNDEDRFIVLASDGLWDVMSSQDVVDFARQIMAGSISGPSGARQKMNAAKVAPYLGAVGSDGSGNKANSNDAIRSEMDKRQDNMAQFIVEEALRRGSADNVTVVIVWFR